MNNGSNGKVSNVHEQGSRSQLSVEDLVAEATVSFITNTVIKDYPNCSPINFASKVMMKLKNVPESIRGQALSIFIKQVYDQNHTWLPDCPAVKIMLELFEASRSQGNPLCPSSFRGNVAYAYLTFTSFVTQLPEGASSPYTSFYSVMETVNRYIPGKVEFQILSVTPYARAYVLTSNDVVLASVLILVQASKQKAPDAPWIVNDDDGPIVRSNEPIIPQSDVIVRRQVMIPPEEISIEDLIEETKVALAEEEPDPELRWITDKEWNFCTECVCGVFSYCHDTCPVCGSAERYPITYADTDADTRTRT